MSEAIDQRLAFAHRLADAAGELIRPYFRKRIEVTDKGPAGFYDPVTEADKRAEETIRELIATHYPQDGILGEEWGEVPGKSGYRWVLDPIDGTRAFIAGQPLWGTLIALELRGKPVLGICRGCQLINVAFGGSLYQDIISDIPTAIEHVSDLYDRHYHELRFSKDSSLARLFSTQSKFLVNSIHHQAVKTLGRDVTIEAVSGSDNIVEAIRYHKAPFVVGLQWHPEFHETGSADLLDCTPILDGFLRAARETRF